MWCRRAQNCPHDFGRQTLCLTLQSGHSFVFVFLDRLAYLCHVGLGLSASLGYSLGASLHSLLTALFLRFENGDAGLADALFVFGGSGFGSGDIGASFRNSTFGLVVTLSQDFDQRPMNDKRVKGVQAGEHDDRWNRSKQ
jgi:hypothetical protein